MNMGKINGKISHFHENGKREKHKTGKNGKNWVTFPNTLSAGSNSSTLVCFSKGAAFALLIVVVMFLDLILGSEIASKGLISDDHGHSQLVPSISMVLNACIKVCSPL